MKKILSVFLVFLCVALVLTSCSRVDDEIHSTIGSENSTETTAVNMSDESSAEKVDSEKTEIPENLESGVNTLSVTLSEGTADCWAFDGQTLTFSGLDADTVCTVSGEFDGQIVIDAGADCKFELELCGVTLYSASDNPVEILSGDKVTLTAKKDSKNFIYDKRAKVTDESAHAACVFADCDLDLGGKGDLTVISENNNGIHSKDNLEVKNLTLSVTCQDNALKGNDKVEINGGVLTLIAKAGDGIKTSNTELSNKGNQKGSVTVSAGTVNIYAACDGIDAAFDAEVSDEAILNIYTDKYSPYSESVETSEKESVRYIRYTATTYNYSVKYYNSDSDYKWVNATYSKSVSDGRTTYYYYQFEKLTDYTSVQIFIYSSGQTQGQDANYVIKSDYMAWNASYDTFALQSRSGSFSYNWTNYSSTASSMGGMGGGPGGMGGGPGGMQDGNTDKGDYSTKGIKAGNEIRVTGGTLTVKSYDDALHANSETALESGATPTGNLVISGGTLTLFSKDDGIHADGILTVSGGTVTVTGSYEGLEGTQIVIQGGNISVTSSDDGMNATATSGEGIRLDGGTVYVYAGGDGLDANSKTSYQGIVFAGADVTVISTSSNNSSIDTEQGYSYTGGKVLALCPSNGMGSESSKCQNFTSVGTKTTKSLTAGQTLSVKVGGSTVMSVTMPCKLSALVIYLGSSSASFG